jgi:hypothetical protein
MDEAPRKYPKLHFYEEELPPKVVPTPTPTQDLLPSTTSAKKLVDKKLSFMDVNVEASQYLSYPQPLTKSPQPGKSYCPHGRELDKNCPICPLAREEVDLRRQVIAQFQDWSGRVENLRTYYPGRVFLATEEAADLSARWFRIASRLDESLSRRGNFEDRQARTRLRRRMTSFAANEAAVLELDDLEQVLRDLPS